MFQCLFPRFLMLVVISRSWQCLLQLRCKDSWWQFTGQKYRAQKKRHLHWPQDGFQELPVPLCLEQKWVMFHEIYWMAWGFPMCWVSLVIRHSSTAEVISFQRKQDGLFFIRNHSLVLGLLFLPCRKIHYFVCKKKKDSGCRTRSH